MSQYRRITAQARLGMGEDEATAWVARCERTGSRLNQAAIGSGPEVLNYDLTLNALGKCIVGEIRKG